MVRAFIAVVAFLVLHIAASAQQRLPNQGTQGVLRSWPVTGVWQVSLVRLVDGGLGCLLMTGHADQSSGERYFWGIRLRNEKNVAASILENNERVVSGSTIRIIVDRVPVGTYQITRRVNAGAGFQAVGADLPALDGDRLLNLVGVAGEMQFITDTSTYSAPLQGASQGLQNLKACSVEASQLGAVPRPTTPPTPNGPR
jgi:hypothetical protein